MSRTSKRPSAHPRLSGVHPRGGVLPAPKREQVHQALLHLQRIASTDFDPVALIRVFLGTMTSLFPGRRFAVQTVAIGGTRLTFCEGTAPILEGRGEYVSLSRDAMLRYGLEAASVTTPVVRTAESYAPLFDEEAHGIEIPFVDGSGILGVTALEYQEGIPFSEQDAFAFLPLALELGSLLRISKLQRESKYQREYLATLLDHSTNAILAVDTHRRLRVVNRTFLELSGRPLNALLGQDFLALLPETQHEPLLKAFHTASRGTSTPDVEIRVPKPNGGVARLSLTVASVLSADGEFDGALAIGRDMTVVRELEEQIIQAEKLATLGQLAAGVVHEINNPLTSITVYADYLLRKGERAQADGSDLEKLRRILEGAQRILNFTRDLIAYARPSSEDPRAISIDDVIEQAVVFCDHVISDRHVRVEKKLAGDLPLLMGVRSQLHQVFINLLTNACQAVKHDHGLLTIETSLTTDNRISVRITDNGAGISEKDQARIFEPFFTTKSEGEGTGLGLSIVRNILRSHGAELKLQSVSGEGTTFTLLFRAKA